MAGTPTAIGTPVSQTGTTGGGGGTVTFTLNTSVAVGDLILVGIQSNARDETALTGITDTAGNTYGIVAAGPAGDPDPPGAYIGYAVASTALSSGNQIVGTFASAFSSTRQIAAYKSTGTWDFATCLDKTAVGTTGSSASSTAWTTASSGTLSTAVELAVAACGGNPVSARTSTPGAGWTELADFASGARSLVVEYQLTAATTALVGNGTWSAGSFWTCALATFKEATGGGTVALAGAIASASTVTGAVTVARPLAGTIAVASSLTGALTNTSPGGVALAGAITATSSLTGALGVQAPLAGTGASTSTLTGALTVTAAGTNPLTGTIAATSTLTGALSLTKPLAGTLAAASTLSANLTGRATLAGTIGSASSLTAGLTVRYPLAGALAATSTLAGAVVVYRPLAGTIAAVSELAATLTNLGPVTAVGRLESATTAAFNESGGMTAFSEGSGVAATSESTSGVTALIE